MTEVVPEFSHILSVARLSPNGVEESLEATPTERAAVAKRFELIELPLLKAQLLVQPGRMQRVAVTGTITADIVQNCVVTLEPLTTHFELNIKVTFLPLEEKPEQNDGEGENLDDEVEYIQNGKIDLGELVAQQLGVNIDLYPRKPDAALNSTSFGPIETKPQPFANLVEVVKNNAKTED